MWALKLWFLFSDIPILERTCSKLTDLKNPGLVPPPRSPPVILSPPFFFGVSKVEDAAEKSEKRAAIALLLKDGLLRLGPTFIKLGQLLSTRWTT